MPASVAQPCFDVVRWGQASNAGAEGPPPPSGDAAGTPPPTAGSESSATTSAIAGAVVAAFQGSTEEGESPACPRLLADRS